jgi:hypothetical protein
VGHTVRHLTARIDTQHLEGQEIQDACARRAAGGQAITGAGGQSDRACKALVKRLVEQLRTRHTEVLRCHHRLRSAPSCTRRPPAAPRIEIARPQDPGRQVNDPRVGAGHRVLQAAIFPLFPRPPLLPLRVEEGDLGLDAQGPRRLSYLPRLLQRTHLHRCSFRHYRKTRDCLVCRGSSASPHAGLRGEWRVGALRGTWSVSGQPSEWGMREGGSGRR